MADYIFLMHGLDAGAERGHHPDWQPYLAGLQQGGHLRGGSAIGQGVCVRKDGTTAPRSDLTGFVRIEADSMDAAKALLAGNPVYEAGGTVEIRELPRDA